MTTHTDIDHTLIEEFRQAFRDLFAQGAYGFDPKTRQCLYETPQGNHCVFGLYIKRKCPSIDLSGLHGSSDDVLNDDNIPDPPGLRELASACQQIHDNAALYSRPLTKEGLKAAAKDVMPAYRDLAMHVLEGL